MSVPYDSGGKQVDDEKYKEHYDRIFSQAYDDNGNCKECLNPRAKGHKMDCSRNWRNQT